MKTVKLSFVLLATMFAVVFSSCDREIVEPETDDVEFDDFQAPGTLSAKVVVKPAIPAGKYQQVFNDMTAKGFRLIFIDGYLHTSGNSTQTETGNYFNAIFEKNVNNISWASFHGLTGSSYQSKFNQYTDKGFRLIHIESYPQNGGIRYAPIFAKVKGPAYMAYHGIKIQDHQNKFENLVDKGFRLVNRSIVSVGKQKYVTALYDKKDVGSWLSKSGLDEDEAQSMMENAADNGHMLGFLDISQQSSANFTYGPIINSEEHDGWYALNKLSLKQLLNEIADAEAKGYKTNLVVGYDEKGLINGNEVYKMRFAASWVK